MVLLLSGLPIPQNSGAQTFGPQMPRPSAGREQVVSALPPAAPGFCLLPARPALGMGAWRCSPRAAWAGQFRGSPIGRGGRGRDDDDDDTGVLPGLFPIFPSSGTPEPPPPPVPSPRPSPGATPSLPAGRRCQGQAQPRCPRAGLGSPCVVPVGPTRPWASDAPSPPRAAVYQPLNPGGRTSCPSTPNPRRRKPSRRPPSCPRPAARGPRSRAGRPCPRPRGPAALPEAPRAPVLGAP